MNMTCNALDKSDKLNIRNVEFDMTKLLRIIAVFFVFLCHGRSYIDGISDWKWKYSFLTVTPAWAGVWIFLFISGYGLGCGYWSGKYFPDNEFTLNRLCNFYKRRFLRIVPIYYLYCALFEIFSMDSLFSNKTVLLKMVTFTFNGIGGIAGGGHLWYVSLAMQLYLLAPILFFIFSKVRKTQLKYVYLFFLVVGLVIRILEKWLELEWITYTYTFVFSNIDLFACGILIAGIEKEENIRTWKTTKILTCTISVILVIYNCYIYSVNSSVMEIIYRYYLPSLYIMICSILILQFNKGIGGKIWKHKVLSFILNKLYVFSQHTYTFYVFHILIFIYVSKTFCTTQFFMDLSISARYVYFFVLCFGINAAIAYIFDNMLLKERQGKNE